MDPAQVTIRRCFQCERENPPEQSFCGDCGAALVLKEYISAQVSREIANTIRDRKVVETEIAINVFERAWRWMKLTFGIFAGAVGLVTAVILTLSGWKAADFLRTVDTAKQSVVASAGTTRNEIRSASAQSVDEIQKASKEAIDANQVSATNALQLSKDLENIASHTKAELTGEAASVRTQVANSQSELEAAKRLQPDVEQLRSRLSQTTSELEAQQKKISSSEEFVKQVLGSRVLYSFSFNNPDHDSGSRVAEPIGNSDNVTSAFYVKNAEATATVIYFLVPYKPIDGTVQFQRNNGVAPPNSFIIIHNLIILFWSDPPESLTGSPLFLSFFPDRTDKDTIQKIILRDGRVFADGEPMPKYRQNDPDFKGNKWIPAPQQPATPKPVPEKVTPEKTDGQPLPVKG